jgi:hypothetical protein
MFFDKLPEFRTMIRIIVNISEERAGPIWLDGDRTCSPYVVIVACDIACALQAGEDEISASLIALLRLSQSVKDRPGFHGYILSAKQKAMGSPSIRYHVAAGQQPHAGIGLGIFDGSLSERSWRTRLSHGEVVHQSGGERSTDPFSAFDMLLLLL